jgi:hypothetical protein
MGHPPLLWGGGEKISLILTMPPPLQGPCEGEQGLVCAAVTGHLHNGLATHREVLEAIWVIDQIK